MRGPAPRAVTLAALTVLGLAGCKGKGDGAPRAEGGYKGKADWKGPPKEGGGYKGRPENFKPKGPPKEGGGYKGKAENFKGPPKDGGFKKPFKKNKSNAGPKG